MSNSLKFKAFLSGVLVLLSAIVLFAADVIPVSVEKDCYRSGQQSSISGTFYRGGSVRLTNWVAFADASGLSTQSLVSCAVYIAVGDLTSATSYTGTIDSAAAGVFSLDFTVTTNSTATQYIEVEVQNTNTLASFVYPWYSFITKARLAE